MGVCSNCGCCNWESNGTSRNWGCSGLCDLNGHTSATPRDELARMVREQQERWAAQDARDAEKPDRDRFDKPLTWSDEAHAVNRQDPWRGARSMMDVESNALSDPATDYARAEGRAWVIIQELADSIDALIADRGAVPRAIRARARALEFLRERQAPR